MDINIKTRHDAVAHIAESAAMEGVMLLDLWSHLKAAFDREAITFSWAPITHFRIASPDGGDDIVIRNVKYAPDAERVVGEIAIGGEVARPS